MSAAAKAAYQRRHIAPRQPLEGPSVEEQVPECMAPPLSALEKRHEVQRGLFKAAWLVHAFGTCSCIFSSFSSSV